MVLHKAVNFNTGQPHIESGEFKMRKKLTGALLSLALAVSAVSFAGSSVPAQAAGQNGIAPASSCFHSFSRPIHKSAEYCEEATSTHHYVYKDITYECIYCGQTAVTQELVGYEEHDLRAADSPHRFECSQCGYQE